MFAADDDLWVRVLGVLRTAAWWLVPYESSENSLDPLEQRLIEQLHPDWHR